jgi:hypothetical protein
VASAKKGITAITNGYAVFKRSLTLASFEGSFDGQMSGRSEHDKGHDTDNGGFEELHDRLKDEGMKLMATGNPHVLYTVESQTQSGVTIIRYICLHLLNFPSPIDLLTYFPSPRFTVNPCAPSDMKGFASTNTGIFYPSCSETSVLLALSGLYLLVPPRICTLPLLSLDIMFGFVFIGPELGTHHKCTISLLD